MNPQNRSSVKDVFLNLGATVALYAVVGSLINLLFAVINTAFPQITNGYYSTPSISWPVAVLIIVFPVLIFLMWLMEREYVTEPEGRNTFVHKLLTYVTLFLSGMLMVGDLITVLYYFLNGDELTVGFLLKVLTILLISFAVFFYYISDLRGKLAPTIRKVWRISTAVVVLGSIVLGFAVMGSPATQRLYKYDQQKLTDLQGIDNQVHYYFSLKGSLPNSLADAEEVSNSFPPVDPQSSIQYGYVLVSQSAKAYQLCAEFNKASSEAEIRNTKSISYPIGTGRGVNSWNHPAGHYCFSLSIPLADYPAAKSAL